MKLFITSPLTLTIPSPHCNTCQNFQTEYSTKIKPLLDYFKISHTFETYTDAYKLTLTPQCIKITEQEAATLFNQVLNQFNISTTCYAIGGNEPEFCIEL